MQSGGVVAIPTETVYGLAAVATNEAAVRRIFAIKGRPADHPLIVHVADARSVARYAADVPASLERLATQFWPGPLTVVLRRGAAIPPLVTAGQTTVAIRVPAHPIAHAILAALDAPLAAPSANPFGRISPTTAAHVRADLGDAVDLVVDGGPSEVGVESTIVDLTATVPAVLRAGAISAGVLSTALGTAVVTRSEGSVRVPGSLASHYAPRARLLLADDPHGEAKRRRAAGERVAVLTLPDDPRAAARSLYAALRNLDAGGDETIVAALPPENEAWAAVRDRLQRASHGSTT